MDGVELVKVRWVYPLEESLRRCFQKDGTTNPLIAADAEPALAVAAPSPHGALPTAR